MCKPYGILMVFSHILVTQNCNMIHLQHLLQNLCTWLNRKPTSDCVNITRSPHGNEPNSKYAPGYHKPSSENHQKSCEDIRVRWSKARLHLQFLKPQKNINYFKTKMMHCCLHLACYNLTFVSINHVVVDLHLWQNVWHRAIIKINTHYYTWAVISLFIYLLFPPFHHLCISIKRTASTSATQGLTEPFTWSWYHNVDKRSITVKSNHVVNGGLTADGITIHES
jgi:hypothetical protein